MRSRAAVAATALLVALAPLGCGGEDEAAPEAAPEAEAAPRIVQPGAPGETGRELTPEELAEIEVPEHTDADVEFMQGMIHHHAQALRMTSLVGERTESEDLALLAERMELSQEGEIELMKSWLRERREVVPEAHVEHGHAHGPGQVMMPGMLTEEELQELEEARGDEFDRLFLEYMIRHHEGALTMVEDLFASEGGGQQPDVAAFARHVDSDQRIEIARMERMLAERAAGGG